jgi:hypothetical protein
MDFQNGVTIGKESLRAMFVEQSNRVQLRLNLWLTLFASYLPQRYRSGKTNHLLRLAEKSMARV